MKVLFLTNIPSPYRVDFFNELGKLCELTVLFEKKSSKERDDSWSNFIIKNFNYKILPGKSVGVAEAYCPSVVKELINKRYDKIVVCNYSTPTGRIAINYMRRHKIKYFIEGDGGFAKSGKGLKEKLKRYFLKNASGYLSTAEEHDKYYLTYGAEKEKIFRYPFTSLFYKDIIDTVPSKENKLKLREELGIREKKVILSVGQFIYRKGFDVLINAMKNQNETVGCYFVGGKETEEYINLKNRLSLNNVHFVGFKNKEELKKYYQSADLFVLPTREDIWGLVINEAMSNGLPIISTNRCIAGLELVKNGENGFIVPVDDVDALSQKIETILSSEQILETMGKKSLDKIRDYTFEQMAKRHMEIFEKCKS